METAGEENLIMYVSKAFEDCSSDFLNTEMLPSGYLAIRTHAPTPGMRISLTPR